MRCPNFLRKTGVVTYGFKCSLYHNGLFLLCSDGIRIEYDSLRIFGKYDKDMQDQFVNTVCKNACESCSLFQVHAEHQGKKN